ncbi:2-oxoglutarate dehydrogenase, E2 component, dihydrolipoamide succinyltransferase [Terrabacter sp. MAHUQ-38]|uniref:2-oxoglutarate dehydrogenase, E2 component, dihydrolipoamide succinyltransferase n=1 Tax=unclassified Terrabacter TaxID=2630222 RepID=UPI00165E3FE3|nr:2-oxoglutarate dehydrogenase, E2 component, dihydrolipoamide succinyltransferase [Terrabacter sp. MAHUQ-38]MBC9821065.1 2-oxoglutarate dehydrogenase, E2 component, dihydrolipoamide succinyltransferase [Terrabacter sp. MAHUQ-38]
MSERVTMPALGESVTEGTVTRWLKNVGDRVEIDEPLLEVSTDKVDTEIPSPVAGTLQEILAQEDDTVPVGADLAVIGDGAAPAGGGEAPAAAQEQPAQAQQDQAQQDQQAAPAPEAPSTEQEPQPATSEPEAEQAEQPQAAASTAGGGEGQTVTMPALGESVTEGTVTRWLKAEGDEVAVDEPLLEVSTDKVDTEIPSPVAGTLTKILVQEDDTVPVGADLAIVGGSAPAAQAQPEKAPEPAPAAEPEKAPEAAPAPQQAQAEAPAQEQPEATPEAAGKPADAERPPAQQSPEAAEPAQPEPASAPSRDDAASYVTPLVRKLASQHGVDLGSVAGTGVGGRIRKQDVLDAAEAAKVPAEPAAPAQPAAAATAASAPSAPATAEVSPKRGTREKMSRLRKVIATRMVESLQVSAQLTTVVEVDLTKVARLRARVKGDFEAREGTKLSFLPFIALAATEALKAHPMVNASVEGDEIVYHGSENLSIAVDTEKGLIVPVVKNAGDLNIAGLARAIADVAARTRSNKITPDDLAGGTFTITNTGSRGALFDTPIINQPQVAILGTGAIVKRPVVVTDSDGGETIAVRSMMYLALSYDHRIVDGADAARFLGTMKTRLEEGRFEA